MNARWFGRQVAVLGVVALGAGVGAQAAQARHTAASHHAHAIYAGMLAARHAHWGHPVFAYHAGGLQCVPFARENTGIELSGNAANWWDAAAGVYERGERPEVGSVLNFRATRRMHMGHVAVVTNVVNSRTIEIDHANWGGPGRVSRNVEVVDVSPSNDWSAVRVGLDHDGDLGSTYPTFGFIYDRPDDGTLVANTGVTPGTPASITEAAATEPEEVAEAEDDDAEPTGIRRHYRRHHGFFGHASLIRVHHFGAPERHRFHRNRA